MQTISHTQPIKKKRTNKLVLGFAAVLASAIVGTTGFAAATGMGNNNGHKPDKRHCAAAGFKNYGQCVKEWAHHKNRPGGGYNGNNSHNTNVTTNLGLEVNGNNNVITVIINIFR